MGTGSHASWSRESSVIQAGGQDVRTAGEELAQLHVGRAEVHQHLPEPGGVPAVGGGGGGCPLAVGRPGRGAAEPSRTLSRYAPKPWRAMTDETSRRRFRSWMASRNTAGMLAPGPPGPPRGRTGVLEAPRGRDCTAGDADDAAVPRGEGEVPGRHPLLPAGRLLRDVLRGRGPGRRRRSRSRSPPAPRGTARSPCAACRTTRRAGYVAKLLERGFKVAICDQVEPPGTGRHRQARGDPRRHAGHDPRRAVARPARVELPRARPSLDPDGRGRRAGAPRRHHRRAPLRRGGHRRAPGARSSAGPGSASSCSAQRGGRHSQRAPSSRGPSASPVAEVDDAAFQRAAEKLSRHLGRGRARRLRGGRTCPAPSPPRAARFTTCRETQRTEPRHVDRISRLPTDDVLLLDESTRANLEVERTLSGGKRKGSLLGLLDRTRHRRRRAPPRRVAPLPAHRRRRHRPAPRRGRGPGRRAPCCASGLAEALRPVADVERLLSRLALRQGNARDLRALAGTLSALPAPADLLEGAGADAARRRPGARCAGSRSWPRCSSGPSPTSRRPPSGRAG